MVTTQATGALGKRSDLGLERLGQATAFREEHLRNIVNAGWLDTMGPQESLQGQFNDLLTLADDIRPTGLLEKHVDRPQPGLGPRAVGDDTHQRRSYQSFVTGTEIDVVFHR